MEGFRFITLQKEVVKICQNGQVLIIEERDHGVFKKITICGCPRCIGQGHTQSVERYRWSVEGDFEGLPLRHKADL